MSREPRHILVAILFRDAALSWPSLLVYLSCSYLSDRYLFLCDVDKSKSVKNCGAGMFQPGVKFRPSTEFRWQDHHHPYRATPI